MRMQRYMSKHTERGLNTLRDKSPEVLEEMFPSIGKGNVNLHWITIEFLVELVAEYLARGNESNISAMKWFETYGKYGAKTIRIVLSIEESKEVVNGLQDMGMQLSVYPSMNVQVLEGETMNYSYYRVQAFEYKIKKERGVLK